MGANAATKLLKIIDNLERILAIELINAAQALDFRRPLKSSPYIEEFVEQYRKVVKFIKKDKVMYEEIEATLEFLRSGDFSDN
jgi:histidine ammonia-lyase